MWWSPFFFISTASSPTRFATPEASLCQDLLPERRFTVTKLSSGSISWVTVLISSHPAMCKPLCGLSTLPANMRRRPNTGQILTHYLRRWPSIKPALGQRIVFAGLQVWQCKPTPTQCLLNVGLASAVLASINSTLVSKPTSSWLYYRHDALNQSWVNLGPPSVMLAHIQSGAKHDTLTQYWANVGSAS